MRKSEPVLTASGITAVILAIFGLLGVTLSDVQIGYVGTIAAFVVPLIVPVVSGWIARNRVTPVEPSRYADSLEFAPSDRVEIDREERPSGTTDPDARRGQSP